MEVVTLLKSKRIIKKRIEGHKKAKFNDIVEGCKKSDIKPRFKGQTKEEACKNIAGAIEVKRRKAKQLS